MSTSAILLVGGMGTRLLPLTLKTPKPMLQVAGVPFTEHQIRKAADAGIAEIVLATSYKSELFEPYFGNGERFGIKIKYAVEEKPLGTGGAIRNAAQLLDSDESVVVLNGDVLSSHNVAEQIRQHEAHDADVTLHLTEVKDARAFGCVPTDSNGRVTAFLEKMDNPVTNQINAGCYVFNPRVISTIPIDTVVSVERETFPQLVAGPIERATNLLPQFYKKREFEYEKAVDGMRQILWGLFKKMVIADNCALIVNTVFENSEDYSGSSLLIGAVLFSFQLSFLSD